MSKFHSFRTSTIWTSNKNKQKFNLPMIPMGKKTILGRCSTTTPRKVPSLALRAPAKRAWWSLVFQNDGLDGRFERPNWGNTSNKRETYTPWTVDFKSIIELLIFQITRFQTFLKGFEQGLALRNVLCGKASYAHVSGTVRFNGVEGVGECLGEGVWVPFGGQLAHWNTVHVA